MASPTLNTQEFTNKVIDACRASILKRLKIARLHEVVTIEHVHGIGEHEFADYLNIRECFDQSEKSDAIAKAEELGAGIAVMYNALLQDAIMVTGEKVVSDLFKNNLKLNFVMNNQPSVADPMGIIPGWVSFKFFFRSSNMLPMDAKLTGNQETLAKAKAQQGY